MPLSSSSPSAGAVAGLEALSPRDQRRVEKEQEKALLEVGSHPKRPGSAAGAPQPPPPPPPPVSSSSQSSPPPLPQHQMPSASLQRNAKMNSARQQTSRSSHCSDPTSITSAPTVTSYSEDDRQSSEADLVAPLPLSPSLSLAQVPEPPALRRLGSTPGAFHEAPPPPSEEDWLRSPSFASSTTSHILSQHFPTPPGLQNRTSSAAQSAISSLSSNTIITATLVSDDSSPNNYDDQDNNNHNYYENHEAETAAAVGGGDHRHAAHNRPIPATAVVFARAPPVASSAPSQPEAPLAHAQPLVLLDGKTRRPVIRLCLWIVVVMAAVALAVGLTLALMAKNRNNNNNGNNGNSSINPATSFLSSAQIQSQVHRFNQQAVFAAVWGTGSDCPVFDASSQSVEIQCGNNNNGLTTGGTGAGGSSVLVIWKTSPDTVCEQSQYDRIMCYQRNGNNASSFTTTNSSGSPSNQTSSAADLRVVFACAGQNANDWTPTATIQGMVASDCQALLRSAAGVDYYGGTSAAYVGLGRYCGAGSKQQQLQWQSQCPLSYAWGLQGYENQTTSSIPTLVNNAHGISDYSQQQQSSNSGSSTSANQQDPPGYICFVSAWCPLGGCPQTTPSSQCQLSTCDQLLTTIQAVYPASGDCSMPVNQNSNGLAPGAPSSEATLTALWNQLDGDVPSHNEVMTEMFNATNNYDQQLLQQNSLLANYAVVWGRLTTCPDSSGSSNGASTIAPHGINGTPTGDFDVSITCGGGTNQAVAVAVDAQDALCERVQDNLLVCRVSSNNLEGSALITCGADYESDLYLEARILQRHENSCSKPLYNATANSSTHYPVNATYGGALTAYISTGNFCMIGNNNENWNLHTQTTCLSGLAFPGRSQDFCYDTATCKTTLTCNSASSCTGSDVCSVDLSPFEIVAPNASETMCTVPSNENLEKIKSFWWPLVNAQMSGGDAFVSVILAQTVGQLAYTGPTAAPTMTPSLRTPDRVFGLPTFSPGFLPNRNSSGGRHRT